MANHIVKTVRQLLVADATVNALVAGRIMAHPLEQAATLPAVTIQLISSNSSQHMGDASGLAESRVQINCYDDDDTDVTVLADGIFKALNRYSGTVSGQTVSHVFADDNAATGYDQPTTPDDTQRRFFYRRDYRVWHAEET